MSYPHLFIPAWHFFLYELHCQFFLMSQALSYKGTKALNVKDWVLTFKLEDLFEETIQGWFRASPVILLHKTKLAWQWQRPHVTSDLVLWPCLRFFLCLLTNMWLANSLSGSLTKRKRDLWLFYFNWAESTNSTDYFGSTELLRLHHWVKDKHTSGVVTGPKVNMMTWEEVTVEKSPWSATTMAQKTATKMRFFANAIKLTQYKLCPNTQNYWFAQIWIDKRRKQWHTAGVIGQISHQSKHPI